MHYLGKVKTFAFFVLLAFFIILFISAFNGGMFETFGSSRGYFYMPSMGGAIPAAGTPQIPGVPNIPSTPPTGPPPGGMMPQTVTLTITANINPSCAKDPSKDKEFHASVDGNYQMSVNGVATFKVIRGKHMINVWKMFSTSDIVNQQWDIQSDTNIQANLRCICGDGFYMAGNFRLTAYGGDKCTKSGMKPKLERTVSVDPAVIPLRSKVKIITGPLKDTVWDAWDTGGAVNGNHIDLFFDVNSDPVAEQKFDQRVNDNIYAMACVSRNVFPLSGTAC